MATTNEQTILNLRGMTITIASDESIYVRKGEMTVHIDFTEGEPLMEWFSTAVSKFRNNLISLGDFQARICEANQIRVQDWLDASHLTLAREKLQELL